MLSCLQHVGKHLIIDSPLGFNGTERYVDMLLTLNTTFSLHSFIRLASYNFYELRREPFSSKMTFSERPLVNEGIMCDADMSKVYLILVKIIERQLGHFYHLECARE